MKYILAIILWLFSFNVNNYNLEFHPHDLSCLTANIFYEARGEGKVGMEVVAKVTMNRVKAKGYPPYVCSVVFQPKQFSWTHQQPWKRIWKVLNGDLTGYNQKDREAYQEAHAVALNALKGVMVIDLPDSVLWYHTTQVKPVWRKKLQKVATIGKHILYKEKSNATN